MPSIPFYVQKTKLLHSRYSLGANAVRLLKSLDDYQRGIIDLAELGRIVRMSNSNRKAVTDIIAKCAAMMEQRPGEMQDCIALIKNCTEILTAADEPKFVDSLPFLKFPPEIRRKIYEHYIYRGRLTGEEDLLPNKKQSNCHCTGFARSGTGSSRVRIALALTCRSVMNEYLQFLYNTETFSFSCACDMHHHLQTNQLLRTFVRSIKVHWCGPQADVAFKKLAACTELRHLTVAVSRATTNHLSRRQDNILSYFPTQRPARICDALGIDELLELRGLASTRVVHIPQKQGSRRTEEERTGLKQLLKAKLERTREV